MSTEFMMVDPSELIIDMPVDEANVQRKMESLQINGMTQPVIVWLQGMRIIDGFHRTAAAQRLGWKEMPCIVADRTEEAFWDARIDSAQQHHQIVRERLVAWMMESWKSSEWYTGEMVDAPGRRRLADRQNLTPEVQGMLKFLWENMIKNTESGLYSSPTSETGEKFSQWLNGKAKAWGMPAEDIVRDVLGFSDVLRNDGDGVIDRLAKKLDLGYEQRQAIARDVGWYGNEEEAQKDSEIIEAWVKNKVANKEPVSKTFRDFRKKEIEHKKEQQVRYLSEAQIAKIKTDELRERLRLARWELFFKIPFGLGHSSNRKRTDFSAIPDAPILLTEFIMEIEAAIKADFTEHDLGSRANPIVVENIALRKKIEEQSERIASLERALRSKGAVSRNVVAVTSGELERM